MLIYSFNNFRQGAGSVSGSVHEGVFTREYHPGSADQGVGLLNFLV